MAPILFYRISECIFLFVNYLRPIFCFFISENPTFIIFGFNNKNTIFR